MIQVGQWDRFEISLCNTTAGDRAELDVTYTKPDGGLVNFWGFAEGNGVWKIRFMPDCLGVWEYRARFSDGSPGASGRFACVPSDIPGMISKDEANQPDTPALLAKLGLTGYHWRCRAVSAVA